MTMPFSPYWLYRSVQHSYLVIQFFMAVQAVVVAYTRLPPLRYCSWRACRLMPPPTCASRLVDDDNGRAVPANCRRLLVLLAVLVRVDRHGLRLKKPNCWRTLPWR
ncbi:hypothetical protein AVEN_20127-1 [Araneus ventricosus]|uniref:Uncharacterized protein n=1 Tax=Araneus ventricosus TaxID=182803 RepID=A0A4Y2VMF3_ARAVE|nr:hypothetical protein AVEN_20127-1 [Araneus ventricosus]